MSWRAFQAIVSLVGVASFWWFCYLTSWQIGLAMFLMLLTNNLSQKEAP
jgi:hypothetical protein